MTLSVGIALGMGGHQIDPTISFHGRSVLRAANPVRGLLHTCQAIPENLIFANVGLTVETTPSQGVLLSAFLFLAWTRRVWSSRQPALFGPLESAGAVMVFVAYAVEWTFRGYLDFQFLRTINLRFIVPWYDSIPQIGVVLLLAGWWHNQRGNAGPRTPQKRAVMPSRPATLRLSVLAIVLISLNRPRVEDLVRATVPALSPSERQRFPIARLQTMRANVLLIDRALWQRRSLRRLDRAQLVAMRNGWGKDAIRAAFGHRFIPGAVGIVRPDLYDEYDAVALLDLPDRGRAVSPLRVRTALEELFAPEPEPRPGWLDPNEKWPP
jgi:hypothetical protein